MYPHFVLNVFITHLFLHHWHEKLQTLGKDISMVSECLNAFEILMHHPKRSRGDNPCEYVIVTHLFLQHYQIL